MAGRGHSVESRTRTPRGELARIRASGARADSAVRARIMEAMLRACGEVGYRNVSVRTVLDRYGGYRVQFYSHFASKGACYEAAYGEEIERLCGRLLAIAEAEGSWRAGLRKGLSLLACFVCERPELARGLLVEVHVAGGPALAKREEVFERLSRAIDDARHETKSRHSPPPITAIFMVEAIEASVVNALTTGDPGSFATAVPELAHMVVAAYFGEEAAGEDMAALRAA